MGCALKPQYKPSQRGCQAGEKNIYLNKLKLNRIVRRLRIQTKKLWKATMLNRAIKNFQLSIQLKERCKNAKFGLLL